MHNSNLPTHPPNPPPSAAASDNNPDSRLREHAGSPGLCTPRRTHTVDGPTFLTTAQFQVLLTLFSKFFASFDHSTCALSVLYEYLALGGLYLPFRAAVPNSPTLANQQRGGTRKAARRGYHAPWRTVPGNLTASCPCHWALTLQLHASLLTRIRGWA